MDLYVERMTRCKLGHPLSDPHLSNGEKENEVQVGDIGYFTVENHWVRLLNVFLDKDSELHKLAFQFGVPQNFTPWKKDAGSFATYSPPHLPRVIKSLSVAAYGADVGVGTEVLPVDARVEFDVEKEHGAVLVLPKSPYRESFYEEAMNAIQNNFLRDYASWLAHVHMNLQRESVKETQLVFVMGTVKTSHWALASFSKRTLRGKLAFKVGVPAGSTSAQAWGKWESNPSAWYLSGPEGDPGSLSLKEEALASLTTADPSLISHSTTKSTTNEKRKKRKGERRKPFQPIPAGEPTPKEASAAPNEPTTVTPGDQIRQDQCVFMTRLKMRRMRRSIVNPFSVPGFKVVMGSGPTEHVSELERLLHDNSYASLRPLDWSDESQTTTTSTEEWTSTVFLGGEEYGQGHSPTRERAREAAAGEALARLRVLPSISPTISFRGSDCPQGLDSGTGVDAGLSDSELSSEQFTMDDSIKIVDPLDLLLQYMCDKHASDEDALFALATDEDLGALLTNENDDVEFQTIIQSVSPATQIVDGVVRLCLPTGPPGVDPHAPLETFEISRVASHQIDPTFVTVTHTEQPAAIMQGHYEALGPAQADDSEPIETSFTLPSHEPVFHLRQSGVGNDVFNHLSSSSSTDDLLPSPTSESQDPHITSGDDEPPVSAYESQLYLSRFGRQQSNEDDNDTWSIYFSDSSSMTHTLPPLSPQDPHIALSDDDPEAVYGSQLDLSQVEDLQAVDRNLKPEGSKDRQANPAPYTSSSQDSGASTSALERK